MKLTIKQLKNLIKEIKEEPRRLNERFQGKISSHEANALNYLEKYVWDQNGFFDSESAYDYEDVLPSLIEKGYINDLGDDEYEVTSAGKSTMRDIRLANHNKRHR